MVVTTPSHALAARTSVAFAEALGLPWIGWSEQGALATHLLLRALAAGRGIEPRIAFPAIEGVLQLVAAGQGITVLPRAIVQRHAAPAATACVPLQDAWARRRLLACWADEGPVAARRGRIARALLDAWRRADGPANESG